MNKNSLKSGMVIELRCGRKYLILDILGSYICHRVISGKWTESYGMYLDQYDDNMISKSRSSMDIMKVYEIEELCDIHDLKLIWERINENN